MAIGFLPKNGTEYRRQNAFKRNPLTAETTAIRSTNAMPSPSISQPSSLHFSGLSDYFASPDLKARKALECGDIATFNRLKNDFNHKQSKRSENKRQKMFLQTLNLHKANLPGIDLRNCLLGNSNFVGANLAGANFEGSTLTDASFKDAELQGANFKKALLLRTNLENADVNGANFEDAYVDIYFDPDRMTKTKPINNLKNANFHEAFLNETNLSRLDLQGVNFESAVLYGVALNQSNLQGAQLKNANMKINRLHQANLTGADLEGANLAGANLQYAILTGAKLAKANLKGANLEGARLEGADARGVQFNSSTRLRDINITNARLSDNLKQAIEEDKQAFLNRFGPSAESDSQSSSLFRRLLTYMGW